MNVRWVANLPSDHRLMPVSWVVYGSIIQAHPLTERRIMKPYPRLISWTLGALISLLLWWGLWWMAQL